MRDRVEQSNRAGRARCACHILSKGACLPPTDTLVETALGTNTGSMGAGSYNFL